MSTTAGDSPVTEAIPQQAPPSSGGAPDAEASPEPAPPTEALGSVSPKPALPTEALSTVTPPPAVTSHGASAPGRAAFARRSHPMQATFEDVQSEFVQTAAPSPAAPVPDAPAPSVAAASAPEPGPAVLHGSAPGTDLVPMYPKRRDMPHLRRFRRRARQRRHVLWVLVLSQVFGTVGVTIGVAVAALLAMEVSGSERLAGSVQTMQAVGVAFGAMLIAALAQRYGRRLGLVVGYGVGALGALLCVASGSLQNFPVLLVGALLLGAASAAGFQARFAAADLAEPKRRGRDLSLVVWSSTIGAIFGPNLVGVGMKLADRVGLPPLTGPFALSSVGLALSAATVVMLLRPDPMHLALTWKAEDEKAAAESEPSQDTTSTTARDVAGRSGGRVNADRAGKAVATRAVTPSDQKPIKAWRLVLSSPGITAAVLAAALNQAIMVSVMIMTPVHMHHGHADHTAIGFTVSLHMVGMFAFSPLFGMLTDRIGAIPVLFLGTATNLMAVLMTATAPAGYSHTLLVGLHILGVGWSLSIIATSTLLTNACPLERRPSVQGWSDLVAGLAAALGGLMAGEIVARASYSVLSYSCVPAVFGLLLCGLVAARFRPARTSD